MWRLISHSSILILAFFLWSSHRAKGSPNLIPRLEMCTSSAHSKVVKIREEKVERIETLGTRQRSLFQGISGHPPTFKIWPLLRERLVPTGTQIAYAKSATQCGVTTCGHNFQASCIFLESFLLSHREPSPRFFSFEST